MDTLFYFESHVTLDPVEGEKLELLKNIARAHKFRVAELFYKKPDGTTGRSTIDSFCSSRSDSLKTIVFSTNMFRKELTENGFVVRRYKIENTIYDSKYVDQTSGSMASLFYQV